MPVQIGENVHSFSDPTALLSDCHRRIEMFLGSLESVGKVIDRPLDAEVARALTLALKYFREAAPKHTADEEESLFPRLRQMDRTDVKFALGRLEELEKDHRRADVLHAEVEKLGQTYLARGVLPQADAERFREAVAGLMALYREHIGIEDREIFPVAARALSEAEQKAIAGEMAGRRNVKLVTDLTDLAKLK